MTENGWTGHDGQEGQKSPPGRGWAAGLRFGDRYEVERLIGEGGWAETYQGRDLLLGRVVALKLLRTQFSGDPALVDRFEREARIAAAISHPHVVTVYDYGTQDGTFFIALQFVAGQDLKHLVVRRGRLPVPEAIGVTRAILSGLGAIHRAGIVHRDVKPQNVLIGDDGLIRITDFGIAHQSLATRVTTHGAAMGTASYMAPEQARGEDVSPATDIYALGVVLYELLTGRLPFNRGHAMAILLAHLQETPEPPGAVAPDAQIPAWLDAVVSRAMAKNPSDRFESATAMLGALDAADLAISSAATTRRFAVGASQAGATLPVPGIDPAGVTIVGGGARAPGTATSPGAGGAPPRTPPPVAQRGRSSRWRRSVALLLLLMAALAIAGVSAANLLGWDGDGARGGGSGDDASATTVATVLSTAAKPTATPEAASGVEPTRSPEPTATAVPEETATQTPAPTTTVPPTQTATEVPTSVPTATAVPTATFVPTAPPPTATAEPETPTVTPVPVEENPPSRQATEPVTGARMGASGDPIVLSADAWTGGAGKKNDAKQRGNGDGTAAGGNDVASVEARSGPKSEAVVAFSLVEVPDGGVSIELQAQIERPEDGPALLSIAVNDATSSPLDISATGEEWGIVEIPVPAEFLVPGENRIVVTAQEVAGARGRAAVILLGDVTVTSAGGEPDGAAPAGAAGGAAATETPEAVVEDGAAATDLPEVVVEDEAAAGADAAGAGPTISPRDGP